MWHPDSSNQQGEKQFAPNKHNEKKTIYVLWERIKKKKTFQVMNGTSPRLWRFQSITDRIQVI